MSTWSWWARDAAIARADELPSTAPPVLMALAAYADAEGVCYPGLGRLARLAGLSERAVHYALRELERADLVRSQARPGKSSLRQLDPCTPCTGTGGDAPSPSGDPCTPCTPPLHPMQGTPAPSADEVDREVETEVDMPAQRDAGRGQSPAAEGAAGEGPHASLDAHALAVEVAHELRHAASAEGRHRSSDWSDDAALAPQVVADLREVIVTRLGEGLDHDAREAALTAARRASAQPIVGSFSGAFGAQLDT